MSGETRRTSMSVLTKIMISLLLAVCAVFAAWAQMHGGPQAPPPPKIALPDGGVTFPMQDFGGRPVVEVMINGKGPFRFILDTGAVISVVSDVLSRELSLDPPAGMTIAAMGGGPAPQIVAIHELRIGDAMLQDMIAAEMPLNLLKGENAPQGVLSAATFPGYLVTFDYPGKTISIKKGALGAADSNNIFQYGDDQMLPTVPVRIAGHETQVHLDTGSGFGLTLPTKFLTQLPLASQPKETSKMHTPGGEFTVSSARVNGTIELGNHKLELDEVLFSDVRPGPGLPAGNVGYLALRNFVVTLDSKNRRIRIDDSRP